MCIRDRYKIPRSLHSVITECKICKVSCIRLLRFYNMFWKRQQVSQDWLIALLVSIFKEGQRIHCSNYRRICLIDTVYTIYSYARIINHRLHTISDYLILEEQNGFRKSRSCTDNGFIITHLIEKRREFNKETHLAFIDFHKALARVDRKLL